MTEEGTPTSTPTGETGGEGEKGRGSTNPSQETGGTSAGQKTSDWREFVPEDLRDQFKDIKDPKEVFEAYTKRPKVPSEYKLPEDFPYKDLADTAKKANLSQEQVDSIVEFQLNKQKEFDEKINEVQKTALAEYKESKGEDWDGVVNSAKAALEFYDPEGQLKKFLKDTGAGNNPMIIEFLHQVGKTLDEDSYLRSEKFRRNKANDSVAKKLYPNLK